MLKSRVNNSSEKLGFQKEVSESRTVYSHVTSDTERDIQYENRITEVYKNLYICYY